MELGIIAEWAERDADECIVERGDSGGWEPDRDGIQRELQRIEPAAGGVLPEWYAVRIGIGLAADADFDSDGDTNCNGDSHCHANPDADDAPDRYSDADADGDGHFNSDRVADCYPNQHAHRDIDIATDCNAYPRRDLELSRQLLG